MNCTPAVFATFALATTLLAQCPSPTSVVAPTFVPVSAGQWGIQHFGQPLAAGQLEYVIISLPAPAPVPFSALPWLFCNTVGNTPCLYITLDAVSWFNLGPSPGVNAQVDVFWPNNPTLVGTLFIAQFGNAGCVGPAPDLSVMVTVQIN
jgi:hypothetical protein